MADGVRTWLQTTEKFFSSSAWACFRATAVGGVVVSKPMAKKMTWRPGLSWASFTASAVDHSMRTSAPSALAFSRLARLEPGTRSRSP